MGTILKHVYCLLLLAPITWKQSLCYPSGAPTSTCINRFPKHHGSQQQTSSTPFTITLNPSTYSAGSTITVTITPNDSRKFVGFVVNAQAATGDTETLIGSFPKTSLPADAKGIYWWPTQVAGLENMEPNCVTHSHNQPRSSLLLQWTAPGNDIGDIIFRAGIVENFKTFWVTENKARLAADKPYTAPNLPTKVNNYLSPPISLTDSCGRTKGCMLYPSGCHGDDCMFAVSYSTSGLGSGVDFEVTGVSEGYLSLAFSFDTAMGRDLTTTCIHKDNIYSVQNGYNPGLFNHRHPIEGVSNIYISRTGDRINCRFTRRLDDYTIDVTKTGPSKISFPLNTEMYVFLAFGENYKGTDIPGKHMVLPLISERKVDLTKKEVVGARTLYPALRAHGSLGITSWIAMIGMAILIARFYKPTLSKKMFGAATWFQVHRALVLVAMLLSVISIILIFVVLKKWKHKSTIHAVFGLIAVGFGLAQIISGLLRPSPGTKKRVWFNWFHRCSGFIGFISAATCVMLSFQIQKIPEPLRTQGTATVAAWLAFYLIWFIILQIMHCLRDRVANNVEHVTKNGLSVQDPSPKPDSNFWRIAHIAWLFLGIIVTVALLVLMLYFINTA